MVAKWPKHVGEIFRVLDNTYVLMCCFLKKIHWVQLVGIQIYNVIYFLTIVSVPFSSKELQSNQFVDLASDGKSKV